jgi:hypothetical protein
MPMSTGTVSMKTLVDYFFDNSRTYAGPSAGSNASPNSAPYYVNDTASVLNGITYYPFRLICGSSYWSNNAQFNWSSIRGKGYVGNMGPTQGPPTLSASWGNYGFYDYTTEGGIIITSTGGTGTNIVQAVTQYYLYVDWDSVGNAIGWSAYPQFFDTPSTTFYNNPIFRPNAAGGRGGGFVTAPSFGYMFASRANTRTANLK